jgi:hypothetical protein
MNFLADLDPGAIGQQHPYRDLQPFPASVDDTDRAVSPLGPAEDLKRRSIKRVERIEDPDFGRLRTQGIVRVGVIIPMSTAWPPRVASPLITCTGSRLVIRSSCR